MDKLYKGDNLNLTSLVLCSEVVLFLRFEMYWNYWGDVSGASFVEKFIILHPCFRVSTDP